MYVVFAIVAALVVIAAVAAAAGRTSGLGAEPDDRSETGLLGLPVSPDGEWDADDLERIRFPVVARGYRMEQVDQVITQLRRQLGERDERIAELEGARAASAEFARRRPGWPDPPSS